jgi:methionyl-tRNA formyltransferase
MAGDHETGVTIFKIDAGLDTGPIAAMVPTEIQRNETAGDLLVRLSNLGVSLLLATIPRIESGLVKLEDQDSSGVTFAPKLFKADGKIDLNRPVEIVENQVRGVTPEPGAWLMFRGESLKLIEVRESSQVLRVGELAKLGDKIFAGCKDGTLELLQVQPAGKPRMSAADWFRGLQGYEFKIGDDVQL